MVYAQYKLHFKKKHYLQMQSFTKTAFANVIYLFTNAVITKTAFVNVIYEYGYYQDRIRKS